MEILVFAIHLTVSHKTDLHSLHISSLNLGARLLGMIKHGFYDWDSGGLSFLINLMKFAFGSTT